MIHFVGAGPGAPDLITRRGAALLQRAGCVIYAGSLVNPALLGLAPEGCRIYNSAEMSLPEVLQAMQQAEGDGLETVRLHTGDQSIYGAVREQMDALDSLGIEWDDTPGVSSAGGRIHAARHQPNRDHHPAGGANPGARERGAAKAGGPRGQHGDLSEQRYAARRAAGLAGGGRLHSRHPGGAGV